jgi:hypothetical protein
VGECLEQFHSLSSVAFRPRHCLGIPLPSFGILRRFLEIVISFSTDSRYSSAGITKALVSAFGEERRLFESLCGGAKVAVVATTTKDSSTCIFTNYNGPKKRGIECGKLCNVGSLFSIAQLRRIQLDKTR